MRDHLLGELGHPAAGFGRRLGAALIDGILLAVVNVLFRIVLGTDAGLGLSLLVGAAYFTYFHGRTGQTPGDAALNIRVVDIRDNPGKPIGYQRALVRWVISYVSAVVILLGYLWMLWDGKRQTWHDKAAGSVPMYLD